MLCVIKCKLHGKVSFRLDNTHQEMGTIVPVFDRSVQIIFVLFHY